MWKKIVENLSKDEADISKPAVRAAYGKLSGYVGIACNTILFLGKIIIGTLSGSVSVTADAVNNLSDASSSVISLMGFKLSAKPADEEHPYGHGRYEYLAGLMVAVLILVIGIELIKTSADKVMNPAPVEFNWVLVAILLSSMIIKLWMMWFNRRIGRRIRSGTLMATAADSRNDVLTTGVVLTAAVISYYTGVDLDGWMGIAVAVFILISGIGLIRDTLDPLLGKAPETAAVKKIRDKIMSYEGVLGTHDLLIHDYGPGRQFASVHVEMAAEADVIVSHDVIDNIEQDFLREEGVHLIVHFDPIITEQGETGNLRLWLDQEIRLIHPDITIHDLRLVPGVVQTKLVFDCVLPHELDMTDGELKAAVNILVRKTYPEYHCAIVVDRDFAAMPHGENI